MKNDNLLISRGTFPAKSVRKEGIAETLHPARPIRPGALFFWKAREQLNSARALRDGPRFPLLGEDELLLDPEKARRKGCAPDERNLSDFGVHYFSWLLCGSFFNSTSAKFFWKVGSCSALSIGSSSVHIRSPKWRVARTTELLECRRTSRRTWGTDGHPRSAPPAGCTADACPGARRRILILLAFGALIH